MNQERIKNQDMVTLGARCKFNDTLINHLGIELQSAIQGFYYFRSN